VECSNLIAAAPELLDALKSIIPDLQLFVSRQGSGPDKRLEHCLAVIAKVEGKT
jgi:hypothetical protein